MIKKSPFHVFFIQLKIEVSRNTILVFYSSTSAQIWITLEKLLCNTFSVFFFLISNINDQLKIKV